MSKSNSMETNFLLLYFNNTTHTGIGDGTGIVGSTVPGSLHVSLHTADPAETGDQTTSECAYTSYARIAVARSSAGWTVSGNNASNTAAITFPTCTGGPETATDVGIGRDLTGVGELLWKGTLDSSLSISNNVQPNFPIGDLDVNED